MNILALSYLFPNRAQPSYGIFVLNRLKAVQRLCDLRVIAPIQWYPFMRRLRRELWIGEVPAREKIDGLDVLHPRFAVVPRYFKWVDAITYFFSVWSVARRLASAETFDFDLVDVHWTYPDIVAGYLLAKRRQRGFIVTVRGHEALYLEENTIRRRLVRHFLRKASYVVTLSGELRDKVIELGVRPDRVRVVLNGVDQSDFHPLDRAACRAELGLPLEKRIIITVGRLTAGKGHQQVIKSMARLVDQNAALYIIGGINPEEDYGRQLLSLTVELGLSNVHFIDRVEHDRLKLWYGAADVFCLASAREGCPNVVMESLACGTPVVATNVGSVAEVVRSGENGQLVAEGDELAFGEALAGALRREWRRDEIAAQMSGRTWSRCADDLSQIYRLVVEQRS